MLFSKQLRGKARESPRVEQTPSLSFLFLLCAQLSFPRKRESIILITQKTIALREELDGFKGPKDITQLLELTTLTKKVGEKVGNRVGEKVGKSLTKNQRLIIKSMVENLNISAKDLSDIIGISQRKIEENIPKLKKKELIKRSGSPKGGHWEVIDKE